MFLNEIYFEMFKEIKGLVKLETNVNLNFFFDFFIFFVLLICAISWRIFYNGSRNKSSQCQTKAAFFGRDCFLLSWLKLKTDRK